MDHVEIRQVIETEQAIGETHDQDVGARMERSASDLSIVVHEEILLDNPPPCIRNVLHCIRVLFRYIFPPEQSTIMANGIDLKTKVNMRISNGNDKQNSRIPGLLKSMLLSHPAGAPPKS